MPNTPVMVRVDPATLAKLDHDRGEVNRSEWIRRLIAAHPGAMIAGAPRRHPVKTGPTPSRTSGHVAGCKCMVCQ
jgi:hypothetical protein